MNKSKIKISSLREQGLKCIEILNQVVSGFPCFSSNSIIGFFKKMFLLISGNDSCQEPFVMHIQKSCGQEVISLQCIRQKACLLWNLLCLKWFQRKIFAEMHIS